MGGLLPANGRSSRLCKDLYNRDDRPFGGTSPPMVAYRFEDSRALNAWRVISSDGYSAYTNLAKTRAKAGSNETIRLAGCWAHLRRKFYDLHISGVSKTATDTIIAMTELWRIEDEVRGRDLDSRSMLRREKSTTIVSGLFDVWEKELSKVSGKSKTAEAIRYALTRREALERFLTGGRIEIDSNIVERAIRLQTITRKNSLFAGSEGGGRTWQRWPPSFRQPR